MYLETYSMEELMELIEEKGYCSVEAVEILKEMEQAKKEYDHALLQEIQKFMTVHLDPQGIILYMDVLGNQPAARNVYKQGGQMW